MTNKKQFHPPLIADPDPSFLKYLGESNHPSKIKPVLATSGKAAQLLIADQSKNYSGIFINPDIAHPAGISVVKFARICRPSTPIFLIHELNSIFEPHVLKGLSIQKHLKKPLTYDQIYDLISPSLSYFDPEAIIANSKSIDKNTLNQEVLADDSNFTPIRVENFMSGTTCYFDIYVRLSSEKYIKILQAGDTLPLERLNSYLSKGLTKFHLAREAQKHYLAYCDQISASLAQRREVSFELKASQILNHGEETIKFLTLNGMNENNVKYARDFLNNLQTLVKDLNPNKQSLIRKFIENVTYYDHGVGVATIAALLIPSLGITSAAPVETIGIAALFHDIGLTKLGIHTEDASTLSKDDYEKYLTHPEVGSQVLGQIRGIKFGAIQGIQQHHERRNRKGFPFQLGTGSISLISEVIGMSDEFFQILEKTRMNQLTLFQKELKTRIYDQFSPKLVSEFRKVFQFADSSNTLRTLNDL